MRETLWQPATAHSSREIRLSTRTSLVAAFGYHAGGNTRPIGWPITHPDSRRSALRALDFQDDPEGRAGSVLHMPSPRLVLWHAVPVVLESVVAPLAAYYFVLLIAGFRGALLGALIWSYLIVARRLVRRGHVSTLLLLGTILLTMRTVISFVTGSLFLYFIQPTASTFLASLALVASALLGRPFTQRFTHDFCPLDPGAVGSADGAQVLRQGVVLVGGGAVRERGSRLVAAAHRVGRGIPLERVAITLALTAGPSSSPSPGSPAACGGTASRSDSVTRLAGRSFSNVAVAPSTDLTFLEDAESSAAALRFTGTCQVCFVPCLRSSRHRRCRCSRLATPGTSCAGDGAGRS